MNLPIEEVLIKQEIAENLVFQDRNILGDEALENNDEFSTLEKLENLNDNIYYSSNLNEEHHIIENFLNKVKKETGFNLITDEIRIKDECSFEATDSDSEDKLNNKSINEGTNKPENFNDELHSEHSTTDDDKKTSKNEFRTPEKPENMNDNMQNSSSSNDEHHVIENFLNRVKTETEFNLIPEEIQIKDECLFQATDSDSDDTSISNNKLVNEGTDKPDNFNDELDSEHSSVEDDNLSSIDCNSKKTSKNCNSNFSEGGKNRKMDQNVQNGKWLKCDKCPKAFTYPSRLKIHSRKHTGAKPYECDVCSKKFTVKHHLINHKRTHTNERPYKCSVCEKTFVNSGTLSQHMRIHTGEKPFQCQVCQYKFSQPASLKTHMRMHTGEKSFHCQVCQHKCAQAANLKEHMRIHTGEKPFQCQLCQFKCAQTTALKRHMRIHTGEKPFKCELCQYKCAQIGQLKAHLRKHTGERPFTCKHCQKAFNQSYTLKVHMQKHHSDKI